MNYEPYCERQMQQQSWNRVQILTRGIEERQDDHAEKKTVK